MNLLGDNCVDAVVKCGGPYTPITQRYQTKVLTPCVIDGVNVLTQKDVNFKNTKYVIKYDFDIRGEEITIPAGCIIEFDGGSICSGTYGDGVINFNDTTLSFYGSLSDVFKDVELKGNYTVDVPGQANFAEVAKTANTLADKTNNTDGMGKIYLKKNKAIQEQMKQPNTIYVVQYDFDLVGKELVVPENCVLEFDGGSLDNGTLVCDNTEIEGNAILTTDVLGTINSKYFRASWISKNNPHIITNIIKNLFDNNVTLLLDISIETDGRTIKTDNILIDGEVENHFSIDNSCLFNLNSGNNNILIRNCNINVETADKFIFINDNCNIKINIENLNFDGKNKCTRFLSYYNENPNSIIYDISIKKSNFVDLTESVILYASKVEQGFILENTFKNIGNHNKVGHNSCITLGSDNVNGIISNVIIKNNIFDTIKSIFSEKDDAKETHAILLYGYENIVEGNNIKNIISNRNDKDPGSEAEAVYLKGFKNQIVNNIIEDGVGSFSDGAITIKGLLSYERDGDNYIAGNTVISSYGACVVLCLDKNIIKGNTLIQKGKDCISITLYQANNNIVSENSINVSNKESCAAAIYLDMECTGTVISNNEINVNGSLAVLYNNNSITYIKDNKIICNDVFFGTNTKYNSGLFYSLNAENITVYFENNSIFFNSVRSSSVIALKGKIISIGNKYNFTSKGLEDSNAFISYLYRFVNITSINDVYNIDSNYQITNILNSTEDNNFTNTIINKNIPAGDDIKGNILFGNNAGNQRPVKAPTIGFQYFDTTLNKPIWWTGDKWADANSGNPNSHKTSGRTDQRPTLQSEDLGFEYYDITLKRAIYWSGSDWVDSEGYPADAKRSGNTESRPNLAGCPAGYHYYDSTLSKFIAWNGSSWVNVDGTSL